jgi:hypothetical protein
LLRDASCSYLAAEWIADVLAHLIKMPKLEFISIVVMQLFLEYAAPGISEETAWEKDEQLRRTAEIRAKSHSHR